MATLCDEDGPRAAAHGSPAGLAYAVEKAKSRRGLFRRVVFPRVGRYEVQDILGRGGMGVVFKAYDEELDRHVALKLLHERDEQRSLRLRREASALAKLSHPNVVQVFEGGQIDGQPFVAMELVPGEVLERWQDAEPRPTWKECVTVYLGAGRGLAAAHAAGLVHRDFKPSNCIVDGEGRVRVLDFGLVVREHEVGQSTSDPDPDPDPERTLEGDSRRSSLTKTGALMGTLGYMSLEQLEGRPADVLSDQFSFCVSLYEAIHGDRPFIGDSRAALARSLRSMRMRQAPRAGRIPARLRRALLRGLDPEPSRRWSSMQDLLLELEQIAVPRPRGWRVLATGALGVGLAGGVALSQGFDAPDPPWRPCADASERLAGVWDGAVRQHAKDAILATERPFAPDTWAHVEQQLDDYARRWVAGADELCQSTRAPGGEADEDLRRRARCVEGRRIELRETARALTRTTDETVEHVIALVASIPPVTDCGEAESLRAEVALPEEPGLAEEVAVLRERLATARVQREAGEYEKSREHADMVVQRGERLAYEPLIAEALLERGEAMAKLARFGDAEDDLKRAHQLALLHEHPLVRARAAMSLARVVGLELGQLERANDWAAMAVTTVSRPGSNLRLRAEASSTLGVILREQGLHQAALEHLQQALDIQREVFGPLHPDTAETSGHIGRLLLHFEGRTDEAASHIEHALAAQEAIRGPRHPAVAHAQADLGTVRIEQKAFDEAIEHIERALAIYRETLGPRHPSVGRTLNKIGVVRLRIGRVDDALVDFEHALSIFEDALPPAHPDIGRVLANMGVAHRASARLPEALEHHRRALEIYEIAFGSEHVEVIGALSNIGFVLRDQGKIDDALEYYRRSVEMRRSLFGSEHPSIARALRNIGAELLAHEKIRQARSYYQQSLDVSAPGSSSAVESLLGLSRVAIAGGEVDVGRRHAQQALVLAEALSEESRSLAWARFSLARILWLDPNERDRSRELVQMAVESRARLAVDERAEFEQWLVEHRAG